MLRKFYGALALDKRLVHYKGNTKIFNAASAGDLGGYFTGDNEDCCRQRNDANNDFQNAHPPHLLFRKWLTACRCSAERNYNIHMNDWQFTEFLLDNVFVQL